MHLLLVDDDDTFCSVLTRALSRRGFTVHRADSVTDALQQLQHGDPPTHALLDLKMPGESGLHLIPALKRCNPAMYIVMLTGYASIATAVEAIKLGATHYLAKPAALSDIIAALQSQPDGNPTIAPAEHPPSVRRLEWEHIQRVLNEHHGNISATARALNMHRRTLQRKLFKHPAQEN
jgi:two-component system response regulator RegA